MTAKAIGVIRATRKASTSLLQRKLGIGYGRAARIIDELEERGVIGPDKGQASGAFPRIFFIWNKICRDFFKNLFTTLCFQQILQSLNFALLDF